MAFSTNDLYPVVFDLKDLDHAVEENRSPKTTIVSFKNKTTTAAASILSSTCFCGHDVSLSKSIPGNFSDKEFSDQLNESTSDQELYTMDVTNDKRKDHHRSQWQPPVAFYDSSQQFVQPSQSTARQIVLAETTTHPKHRQLEDDYVLTQQVRQERKRVFLPRLHASHS
jgi:hypothetical protein